MRTLLVDTASSTMFVGLVQDGLLVADCRREGGRAVADLHPLIEELLKTAKTKLSDINEFGVVRGPGNWTGVNVGVVAVKMMAIAFGAPILLISRMQALIDCAPAEWTTGHALLATGRMSHFYVSFSTEEIPRGVAGLHSTRLTSEEVRATLPSSANIVGLLADAPASEVLGTPDGHVESLVSFQEMVMMYLKHLENGSAERLVGEQVHLALPDYAGADRTIKTSAGSFR